MDRFSSHLWTMSSQSLHDHFAQPTELFYEVFLDPTFIDLHGKERCNGGEQLQTLYFLFVGQGGEQLGEDEDAVVLAESVVEVALIIRSLPILNMHI